MLLTASSSAMDSLMFGIPLIALLVFGYFRLDELFVRKPADQRDPAETERQARLRERNLRSMQSDPDGRPW